MNHSAGQPEGEQAQRQPAALRRQLSGRAQSRQQVRQRDQCRQQQPPEVLVGMVGHAEVHLNAVFGSLQDAIHHQQRHVRRQHHQANRHQALGEIELPNASPQPTEASHCDHPGPQAHPPGHHLPGQRGFAQQNERHQHQQVFQPDQQGGVIPDPAPRQQNGREHQEDFIALKRAEVEPQLGKLAAQEISVHRNAVKAVEQERRADQVERITSQKTLYPVLDGPVWQPKVLDRGVACR